MNMPQFIAHFTVLGHLNCFQFWDIKKRATIFIQLCVSDELKYIVLLGTGRSDEVLDLEDTLIWGTGMDKFLWDHS